MKTAFLFSLLCLLCNLCYTQELEPRAYAALPKNLNSLAFVYGLTKGNVLTDPSLPIKDMKANVNSLTLGYVHTFGLANKLARVQIVLPYMILSGKLKLNGVDTSITRSGFSDARLRLGINLTGSPPLDKKDFVRYTQKTIVGVSLVTSIPIGYYEQDKRINPGSNRWGFKPEIGISKRFKRVYAELYSGVWFYTANTKYLVTKTQIQKPVFNIQGHASYYFKRQMWVSINANWFNGGKTLVDGEEQGNLLDNWRIGATWSFPIAKGHSLKLQFHVGAFTESGYDYNAASLAYQWVF
ncbi:transporter [Pinibacter aurantiacus]|uniref:Transporter n=1 Tax=Pinibacter aurantiacus TaxID=2851599 RepID=A0A9E2S8P2_9BACT|nr:transporter [Pinibacter aurantiacus]MBV4356947.1 transporter [Pinibacter aurantiacus]